MATPSGALTLAGWKTGTPFSAAISLIPRPPWQCVDALLAAELLDPPAAWPGVAALLDPLPVRLGEHPDHRVRAGQQRCQRRLGERARPHQDQAHGPSPVKPRRDSGARGLALRCRVPASQSAYNFGGRSGGI